MKCLKLMMSNIYFFVKTLNMKLLYRFNKDVGELRSISVNDSDGILNG